MGSVFIHPRNRALIPGLIERIKIVQSLNSPGKKKFNAASVFQGMRFGIDTKFFLEKLGEMAVTGIADI